MASNRSNNESDNNSNNNNESGDNDALIFEAIQAGMIISAFANRNSLVLALSKLDKIDTFHKILYSKSMDEPENILSDYVNGRHIIDYHNGLADIPMPSYADVILLNTVGPQRLIRTIETDDTFANYCNIIMNPVNRGKLTPTDYYYHLCLAGNNIPSKLSEQEANRCRLAVGRYGFVTVNDQTAADVVAHARKISQYPALWEYQRSHLSKLINKIKKEYKLFLCEEDMKTAVELFGISQDPLENVRPEIRGYLNNCPLHISDDYDISHPLTPRTSINEENTIGEDVSTYRDFDRIDVPSGPKVSSKDSSGDSSNSGFYTFTREEFPTLLKKGTNFYTNEPLPIRCICEIEKRLKMAKMMELPECLPAVRSGSVGSGSVGSDSPSDTKLYQGQAFTPKEISSPEGSSSRPAVEILVELRDLLQMVSSRASSSPPIGMSFDDFMRMGSYSIHRSNGQEDNGQEDDYSHMSQLD